MAVGFFFVCGLLLLIAGAEVLVRGATRLALELGISPLLVGLTVVAYATSSPELAVSIVSVRAGQSDIAMGNVVGSNIFNVLFILGISAAILPLIVSRRLVRLEMPLMLAVSVLLYIMASDGGLSRIEGAILVITSIAYTALIVFQGRREARSSRDKAQRDSEEGAFVENRSRGAGGIVSDLAFVFGGLLMLVLGARWLVAGAITFASYLGISESVIALTIVASGTSLPEVATSIVAVLRGQRDMAVGNVVGSNIFNILAVLGVSAVVSPVGSGIAVPQAMLDFDLLIMTGAALACLPVAFSGYQIARWEGFVFLGNYVAYTTFLVLKETGSTALPLFQTAMLGFFLPITALTLFAFPAHILWAKYKGRS